MHCGVMVTGYNQGDWERLLAEDYSRPPAVSDAANMDDTLYLGELVEPPEPPRVERVDLIPLTPGGKLKTLVSSARR